MAIFGFGTLVERAGRNGPMLVPEYALHIQETWRIRRADEILLGYADWHYPPAGSGIGYEEFVEADERRNRQDDLRDAWMDHGTEAHTVDRVGGSKTGDLVIAFVDGCTLETFVNQASYGDDGGDELWRLVSRRDGAKHFVVTARGSRTLGRDE